MIRRLVAVIVAVLVGYVPARALEEQPGETQAIKSCEERLCTMLLRKEPRGDDLKCELTKTWARKTIKGAETKGTTWGFGDARCTVQLNISRALIVGAMTQPAFKLHVPTHTAHCVVEQDGVPKTVKATLAPKIVFKDGKAEKVWIRLLDVEGPTAIRDTLKMAAQLEDGLGIFHRAMIKSINKFIHTSCARNYPQALVSAAPATSSKMSKPPTPAPRAAPK